MIESILERECGGKAFLVTSCTAGLELSCMAVLNPGDEVIVPSWGHPANVCSVVRAGGIPVFVDVDRNLNLDPARVLAAVTHKTKAIMPVHYAGVRSHDFRKLADEFGLYLIEDAAQAIGDWRLTGHFGAISFHKTKNIQCGEGGALIVSDAFAEKIERLMYWGTDKAKFNRGETSSWQFLEMGGSYALSEHAAAYLLPQLERLQDITERRRKTWRVYESCLGGKRIGNGHLYWFEIDDRDDFIEMARGHGIKATAHFEALHTTIPGIKYGRVAGPINRATKAMRQLVKLDTSISEDRAIKDCVTLFPEKTLYA